MVAGGGGEGSVPEVKRQVSEAKHSVQRSRKYESIYPLPHTSKWRSVSGKILLLLYRRLDSLVDVEMGYVLETSLLISGRSKRFSLLNRVHICSGAYTSSHPLYTGGFLQGVNTATQIHSV
jgi:hypothetical protein